MAGLEWLFYPPFSALAVFGITFLMSLTMTLLNRKLVNQGQFAEWQGEMKRWNADKERAKKTGDKKLLAKLKKQEKRISQMQSKMLKGQMLNMVITMGLFFLVWQVLTFVFADPGRVYVARLPFSIPFLVTQPGSALPFYLLYIVCSFFSSSIVQRILGVRTGMGMGMGMQPQTQG